MDTDLFGNDIKPAVDAAEEEIRTYDQGSFSERLLRLKYVNKLFPFGTREYGSDESHRIFNEAIHCFIFGQYIATVILSLSFIERRFQEYFHIRMDKRSKLTLSKLLIEFRQTGFIDEYFINKIDKIRLKRNPFVHHKEPLYPHSLMSRSMESNTVAEELLEQDAKDALGLMLVISKMRVL